MASAVVAIPLRGRRLERGRLERGRLERGSADLTGADYEGETKLLTGVQG
jgi:hypothetical protein